MGLSVTATYGIIFTASLLMFGVLFNSLIYSYDNFQNGLNNRVSLIESRKNQILVERVVLNESRIEILAVNKGPETIDAEKMSVIVNGNLVNFSSEGMWFPGEEMRFFVNSSYSLGSIHEQQFKIAAGMDAIASSEEDKIYVLNSTGLFAYHYSGTLAWEREIDGPRDVSSSQYIFVLNRTGILKYDRSGNLKAFFSLAGITSLDSRGPYIYAVNKTKFLIINSTTGAVEKSVDIADGKDVAVGRNVYVLNGSRIDVYDYSGNRVSSISDSRLQYAEKITSDRNLMEDCVIALTSYGNLLVYSNGSYSGSIYVGEEASNVDLYGKIYISSISLLALDGGYRIKLVDEFGNEVYGFL